MPKDPVAFQLPWSGITTASSKNSKWPQLLVFHHIVCWQGSASTREIGGIQKEPCLKELGAWEELAIRALCDCGEG